MKIQRQIKHEAGIVLMMRTWTIVFSLMVALPLTILSNDHFHYQNIVWAYVGHFLALEACAYCVGRKFTFLHGAYVLLQKKWRTYLRLRRNLSYLRMPVVQDSSLEEQRQVLYQSLLRKFMATKSDLKLLKACTTART